MKEELQKRLNNAVIAKIKFEGITEYLSGWLQEIEEKENADKQEQEEQEKESGS